jgi:predicted secreted protein
MLMKKTAILSGMVLLAFSLWAGDTASFVDLGFSPDGQVYMFAQYGVQTSTLRPWADLFAVDVPRNDFVSGGKLSYIHESPVMAGQDGSGAFFRLLSRNGALADQNKVTFMNQGKPLYISLENGDVPSDGARSPGIEFRDFGKGDNYRAVLVPYTEGTGANLKSSFYIELERTAANGSRKSYTIGTPGVKRPLIASYKIKKVIVAPREGSIIFVIETHRQADSGYDVRYMVEALKL